MFAVYKREFKSSLNGMTGPIFIFAVLLIVGFFTFITVFASASTHFESVITNSAFLSLLLTPILTMRSFSEERRMKTDQLLYSLPITATDVVLGKYLAMVSVFAIPCAIICTYPFIAMIYAGGGMNLPICYGAILAYFLLGCALIAICMLISSFFESTIICAIISLAVTMGFFFSSYIASIIPEDPWVALVLLILIALVLGVIIYTSTKNVVVGAVSGAVLTIGAVVPFFINDGSLYTGLGQKMVSALLIFNPIGTFNQGLFDITCFIYYLSIAALFVFVTVQSFERRRWN